MEDFEFPEGLYDNTTREDPYKAPENLTLIDTKRNEYEMQIDRAFLYRIGQDWPLYSFADWEKFKLPAWYWESLPCHQRPARASYLYCNPLLENGKQKLLLEIMQSRFPCVFQIMELYPGKIFPCGGFFSNPFESVDIDLFFVNCSEQEASKIMLDFESLFLERHSNVSKAWVRTSGASTFVILYKNKYIGKAYQFVHRIYPSLAHVLGGFDLSCSMIAYNGKEIVANEMGAWAWVNHTIVVDISRRSLSFQHRLLKYFHRGFNVIFPGVHHDNFEKEDTNAQLQLEAFYEALKELKIKHNVVLKYGIASYSKEVYPDHNYQNDYGYGKSLNGDDRGIYGIRPFGHFLDFRIIKKENAGNVAIYTLGTARTYYKSKKKIPEAQKEEEDYSPPVFVVDHARQNLYSLYTNAPNKISIVHFYNKSFKVTRYSEYKPGSEEIGKEMFIHYIKYLRPVNNAEKESIDMAMLREGVLQVQEKLLTVEWMTQDPGRQWSSTVNPAIVHANEFYCGKWNGLMAIPVYNFNLYLILRLASRNSPESSFYGIPDDVIRLILKWLPLL